MPDRRNVVRCSHQTFGERDGADALSACATGLMVAGLAIVSVPWVENVVALGSLLVLAFFGNDLAMAPAWAAAADIGERHTGTVAGTMNMTASFMAAAQARLLIGSLFKSEACHAVSPVAASYALGTLAWIGVDVRPRGISVNLSLTGRRRVLLRGPVSSHGDESLQLALELHRAIRIMEVFAKKLLHQIGFRRAVHICSKRHKSPSKKGMRRSHDFLVAPALNICPQCKLAVPPTKCPTWSRNVETCTEQNRTTRSPRRKRKKPRSERFGEQLLAAFRLF